MGQHTASMTKKYSCSILWLHSVSLGKLTWCQIAAFWPQSILKQTMVLFMEKENVGKWKFWHASLFGVRLNDISVITPLCVCLKAHCRDTTSHCLRGTIFSILTRLTSNQSKSKDFCVRSRCWAGEGVVYPDPIVPPGSRTHRFKGVHRRVECENCYLVVRGCLLIFSRTFREYFNKHLLQNENVKRHVDFI